MPKKKGKKKLQVPISKLMRKPQNPSKELSTWNKYAEERINDARESKRITGNDMKIIVNT